MLKKYKNLWISLVLLISIFLVLALGYVGFIAGPKRAYEKEDHLYLTAYVEQNKVKKVELLNRFSYDEVYYIIREDDQDIVVFNKDFSKQERFEYVDKEQVLPVASDLSFKPEEISYGYYQDALVFVLKNKNLELFVSTDELKIVYHLGSEF